MRQKKTIGVGIGTVKIIDPGCCLSQAELREKDLEIKLAKAEGQTQVASTQYSP